MLKNMKIGVKLLGGFIIVSLLLIVVGSVGFRGISNMGAQADIILDEEVPVADASMEMLLAVISGRDVMGEYLLCVDLDKLDAIEDEFYEHSEEFDTWADGIVKGVNTNEMKIIATDNQRIIDKVDEAQEFHAKFENASREMMEFHRMALESENRELSEYDKFAYEAMEQLDEFSAKADEAMVKVEKLAGEEMDAAMQKIDNLQSSSKTSMVVFTIIGFLLAFTMGFLLSRAISNPLQSITEIAEAIANGDLDQKSDIVQKDEIGQLAASINDMSASLKRNKDEMQAIMNMANGVVTEVNSIADKQKAGDLEARAVAGDATGEYLNMVEGFNGTLDAVINPILEGIEIMR